MTRDFINLMPGTYVLATKWTDGDSGDQWAIGFAKDCQALNAKGRYDIVDSDGKSFRGNGFMRAEPITSDEGDYILSLKDDLDRNWGVSLWKVLAKFRGSIPLDASIRLHACPSCGADFEPGDKFCSNCGTKLEEDSEP